MSIINILSLGAGVQSTTVYLMSLYGVIPPYDHVIFADTGWEPTGVYEHLEKLKAEGAKYGSEITVVSAGNIREDHLAPAGEHLFIRNPRKHPEFLGKQRTFIPFFVQSEPTADNTSGKGKTFRTCTKTYKIEPVEKRIREILGLKPNARWPLHHVINQTMGISWDESQRMRESGRPAIVNQYPLIDMRMTRDHCHDWMAEHGWTAPRSACIGCPFHRNDEWRRMRDDDPEAFADAIEFDDVFRQRVVDGLTPLQGVPYLHDTRVPLREADIDSDLAKAEYIAAMAGQSEPEQVSFFDDTMFGADCEGLCGT